MPGVVTLKTGKAILLHFLKGMMESLRLCAPTWRSSDPSQAQHPIIKVSVSEDISQAELVMVLFWIELQKLLHSDVGKAEGVGFVSNVVCGIDL